MPLLKRAGTMSFKEVLEPAAPLAEQGFGVTERIRNDWIYGAEVLCWTIRIPSRPTSSERATAATYALFRNPDLAHTFRMLQAQGRDAFYKGEIAQAIVAKIAARSAAR